MTATDSWTRRFFRTLGSPRTLVCRLEDGAIELAFHRARRDELMGYLWLGLGFGLLPLLGLVSMAFMLFALGSDASAPLAVVAFPMVFMGGMSAWALTTTYRSLTTERVLLLKPDELVLKERRLGIDRRELLGVPRDQCPQLAFGPVKLFGPITSNESGYRIDIGQQSVEVIRARPPGEMQTLVTVYDAYRAGGDIAAIVDALGAQGVQVRRGPAGSAEPSLPARADAASTLRRRPLQLVWAAWVLIVWGVVETVVFVCAIAYEFSYSGGAIFYCFAGVALLRGNAATYRRIRSLLLMFLVLATGAVTAGLAIGWLAATADAPLPLTFRPTAVIALPIAAMVLVVMTMSALINHPESRKFFDVEEAPTSWHTLHVAQKKFALCLAGGVGLTMLLMGPQLLDNPFRKIAAALVLDQVAMTHVGAPQRLVVENSRVWNWTAMAEGELVGGQATLKVTALVPPRGEAQLRVQLPAPRSGPAGAEQPATAPATAPAWGAPAASESVLLQTSFEDLDPATPQRLQPFVQLKPPAWRPWPAAHSGRVAINAIPDGNSGRPNGVLSMLFTPSGSALLSSRSDGVAAPFEVSQFAKVRLQLWRNTTSNPSIEHNCMGSLALDVRFDGGRWQPGVVFCGRHRDNNQGWKQSSIEFDTRGKRTLEFRFSYESRGTRDDPAAYYLIDDLSVIGVR